MASWRRTWVVGCVVVCLGVLLALVAGQGTPAQAREAAAVAHDTGAPAAISVVGNQLQAHGAAVQLRGVNSNAYDDCGGGTTFYDTTYPSDPNDDWADQPVNQASVSVMKSWGINAVRLAVNESCWLGQPTAADGSATSATLPDRCEPYTSPEVCETAAEYRAALTSYVNLLSANGLYVVIELQTTAPTNYPATQIDYFPDAANAPTFWQQVASSFGSDSNILFDLSGEWAASPYGGPYYQQGTYGYTPADSGQNWSEADIWNCWLNGCQDVPSLYGVTYATAGVQPLVSLIRQTGAENPIILGTPDYTLGYDEDGCGSDGNTPCWRADQPADPDGQLVYDAHMYDFNFGGSASDSSGNADPTAAQEQQAVSDATAYIDSQLVPLARRHPVMLGELGEASCQDDAQDAPFVPAVLGAVDRAADDDGVTLSVFGWTWDTDLDHGDQIASGWQCPTRGPYGQGGPLLISDYDGTPTGMGQVFKNWFLAADPGAADGSTTSTASTPTATATSTASTPTATVTSPATTSAPSSTGTRTSPGSTATSPGPGTTSTPAPNSPVITPAGGSASPVLSAPHIVAAGTTLSCTGAAFTSAASGSTAYSWYDTKTGKRLAGPAQSPSLAVNRVYDRAIICVASRGAVSAHSALFAVPGQITSAPAGWAELLVICPAGASGACVVDLALTAHGRTVGHTRMRVRTASGAIADVRLSSAGRSQLRHGARLPATLVVTETVSGIQQTVARSSLTFHG